MSKSLWAFIAAVVALFALWAASTYALLRLLEII